MFKDFLYYDDINEFFKRPYETHESEAKMALLIEYYQKEDNVFPNLCKLDQNKVMKKRYRNIYKYYDRKERGIIHDLSDSEDIQPKSKEENATTGSRVLTSNF